MAYGDLKPANIIIERFSDQENEITINHCCYKIKLIDLGSIVFLKDN
jgi:serine/threonine protein kinase